ncbi:hypothetical protein CONCODRAFT_69769 [Conidiobolus coronatus NRRL 28638]|uniref:F-box domain-containing protein n=1 Tax=Conidiobolus coronatus (strain ATCC 28846 / CBS 209.66 / NRRL 28638) TaxID=796925 RepID=A0A137P946_CONC2|nr:hypothetical protein CONCODRAFT_69769 [Conidiobolus coronatus NRRL 28638]|eukprot:KXN71520.1 hypothetical protein CONCODRAFT_69769 [Conidiobolus coronatus NRRL 28638]
MNKLIIRETEVIDWKLVLASWDTAKYIPKVDLICYSKSCKFIRNKLISHIFKSITLISFSKGLPDMPLNTLNSGHEKEVLDRYRNRLYGLIPYVKSLAFKYENSETLFFSVSQVFHNLSRLELSSISITISSFHKTINDLNHLEHLHLKDAILVVFENIDDPAILQLPSSLISFKISYGMLFLADFDSTFSIVDYVEFSDTIIASIKFNIQAGSLPNLKMLEIDQDNQDFIESQSSLILASGQLTKFTTRLSFIKEIPSDNLHSLTSLVITNIHQYYHNNTSFTLPTLRNLKELRISSGYQINGFEERLIPSRFKFLANIGKNIGKLTLEYFKFDKFSIEDLLSNFNNLLELNLVYIISEIALNHEKFPLTIKSLNLYRIKPKLLNINSIKSCSGLEAISISYEGQDFIFEESEFSRGIESWRIINFPGTSIRCYRIK